MKLNRLLFALVSVAALCGVFSPVHAATGNAAISFTRATTYTDNSALATADITGYAVGCTFAPTGGTAAACTGFTGSPLAGGSNQAGTVTMTVPAAGGQVCFTLKTLTAIASSAGTAPFCKTFADTRVPGDPTNATLTITLTLNLTSASPITVALAGPPVVTRAP